MLDVLALSNSSMVERRLGLIRLNGDACSKRADPFIFFDFEDPEKSWSETELVFRTAFLVGRC